MLQYLLLGLILTFSPSQENLQELKPGESIERALAGGEAHRY